jgi:hypothetical protein
MERRYEGIKFMVVPEYVEVSVLSKEQAWNALDDSRGILPSKNTAPRDVCPKCGSENVAVGNFPLECLDCDWHFLNEYPCDICGGPSVSACGTGNKSLHRCRQHPWTKEEQSAVFREFFSKFLEKHRG